MKIVTLVENSLCGGDACREDLHAARGMSLYAETAGHKVLFDMGPGAEFLNNAKALGVDLAAVDTAVLSHGHSDHGGGLEAFCRVNSRAQLYLRREAFHPYYAVLPGQEPQYIGLETPPDFLHKRAVFTDDCLRLDGELLLFSDVADDPASRAAAPKLQEKIGGEFRPDVFAHEQHLLLQSQGRAVLLAGCAHKGIVSILAAAKRHLGRMPDAVFGGFHLFELPPDEPASAQLIDRTAKALLEGGTVYYTGHCTGDWAYGQLKAVLGDRLQPMNCGTVVEI